MKIPVTKTPASEAEVIDKIKDLLSEHDFLEERWEYGYGGEAFKYNELDVDKLAWFIWEKWIKTQRFDEHVRIYDSPLTSRGYIRFINMRLGQKAPQGWVCDECLERVPLSKQESHVKHH